MKATVLQKDFGKILNNANRFVSARAQLPILANIKIKAHGSKITVEATNLEMSISANIGASVEEEGEVAVPSRVISDLVGNIRAEKITLGGKGETLTLEADGLKSEITGLNTSDFPAIPSEVAKGTLIPSDEFSKALSKVLFSSSPDDTRPALAGVLFIFGNDALSLVSSDGFRLSQKDIPVKNSKEGRVIIPKGILSELPRLFSEGEINVFVDKENKQVLFGLPDIVVSSRLVEGEYPPFEKIIPESSSITVDVNKDDFQNAIKTASVFARDAANIVKLQIKEESIVVSVNNSKSGTQESSIEAKVEGPEVDILYNYRYLEEFLNVIKSENVLMKFNSGDAAGVFLEGNDNSYLHLVMPVKS
jgi:DNA polymerase-3 subunit beta